MGGFRALHRPLGWCRSVLVAASGAIPAIGKLPADKISLYVPQAIGLVRWCDAWVWMLAPACVGLAAALGYFRRKIIDPDTDEALQEILNHLHKQMFPAAVDERSRLTLFRFKRWQFKRWPWRPQKGGWLIAVKRSGDMHQDFTARFQVGEDLTDDCGIAGKAWCDIADTFVVGLPDISAGKGVKRDMDRYAKETCMPIEWVRAHKPRSRSFYGMKIRHKQEKWGVIVIDTRDPHLDRTLIAQVFGNTQRFLALYASKV